MFAKIVTIAFLILICVSLIFSFVKWIWDECIYNDVNKNPEKYDIVPGAIIKLPYEYGYPGTYEVYIKDVNKETRTVSFTSTKYEDSKTEISNTPIENFYWLYIEGHAINPNRYDWPEDYD